MRITRISFTDYEVTPKKEVNVETLIKELQRTSYLVKLPSGEHRISPSFTCAKKVVFSKIRNLLETDNPQLLVSNSAYYVFEK